MIKYYFYFDDKPTETYDNALDALNRIVYLDLSSSYSLLMSAKPNPKRREFYYKNVTWNSD